MTIHTDSRKALFKSKTHKKWQTPLWFFSVVNLKHKFVWDMAASGWNALCEKYVTKKQDALSFDWPGNTSLWCNPPYSRALGKWLEKGWDAAARGSEVVFLIHGRIDTVWFHRWAVRGTIIVIKGRLKFLYKGHELSSATFPSILLIFNKKHVLNYAKHGITKLDVLTWDANKKEPYPLLKRFPREIQRRARMVWRLPR